MTAIDQGLFKGVAIVIDDQAEDGSDEQITKIQNTIRTAGGHLIVHTSLPRADADLENYTGVSFVIMDWYLWPSGTQVSDALREQSYAANVEFIRKLGMYRHTPVVIFTNEELGDVRDYLKSHNDMVRHLDSGRLLLMKKDQVGAEVYQVLNDWAKRVPSVLTLKTWERECARALNDLFIDLYDRSPHWPVMLWETYRDDGPSAADDLSQLITRLVASRMNTLGLNLDQFMPGIDAQHATNKAGYEKTLKSVLEGERVLDEKRLHGNSVAPGDFFQPPNDTSLYINVRPECDVVIRDDKPAPKLYLLQGKKVTDNKINLGNYGEIIDHDPKYTVYAMFEGSAYCFKFRDIQIGNWSEWKPHRKGRLLPPFSTRLQQKYAGYLQRTGLPTVPKILRPVRPTTAGDSCALDSSPQAETSAAAVVTPADLALPAQHD